MAQPEVEPQVIDSARLSVRDGPYGRTTTTSVEQYSNGDVVLRRVNGDNQETGMFLLQREQARPFFAGPARLHGQVFILESRPGRKRREAWCEGDTMQLVIFDANGMKVTDGFRLFGDEVTPFLTFVWHHLAQAFVA